MKYAWKSIDKFDQIWFYGENGLQNKGVKTHPVVLN